MKDERGEPEDWPGGKVNPRMERRTPMQVLFVELTCVSCRPGRLVSTGEKRERGLVHACTHCTDRWVIPGEPYPRRVEEIDRDAALLPG